MQHSLDTSSDSHDGVDLEGQVSDKKLKRWLHQATSLYNTSKFQHPTSSQAKELRSQSRKLAENILYLAPKDVDTLSLLSQLAITEGEEQEALTYIDQAISNAPNDAECWYRKGQIHLAARALEHAEVAFQRALSLKPDVQRIRDRYAYTLFSRGRIVEAFQNYQQLVDTEDDPKTKSILFKCLRHLEVDHYNPILEQALCKYFQWSDLNHYNLENITASLLCHKYPLEDENAQIDVLVLAEDKLFTLALQKIFFRNIYLEKLITAIRAYMLGEYRQYQHLTVHLVPLAVSIALNAKNNDYIFWSSDEEEDTLDQLEKFISSASEISDKLIEKLPLYAMYRPLSTLPNASEIARIPQASWPKSIALLVDSLLHKPLQLHRYPARIARLGTIENSTSKAVQDQYETCPYPHWLALEDHPNLEYWQALKNGLLDFSPPALLYETPLEILIAGCGTGRQALEIASYINNVNVLAMDISRNSLHYAAVMADKYQIPNIQFIQADILNLEKLNKKFHIIECSGVLHHMEDPQLGAQFLTQRLKPDGILKLALYSKRARRDVIACRQMIAEKGLTSSLRDIRSFRQLLLSKNLSSQFQAIIQAPDFYTLNGCRDMLFHAHEEYFTPRKIWELCDNLSIDFLGFIALPLQVRVEYLTRFPGDMSMTNLLNWEEFEKEFPATFPAMYQFYGKKSADNPRN